MIQKIYAHRGASGYAPENTLEAFALAAEMGAHGVELDVHIYSLYYLSFFLDIFHKYLLLFFYDLFVL